MSITGAKFLKVTKAEELSISGHAMDRLEEHLGFRITAGLARAMFRRSRQVKAAEIFLLGYRPAYTRRAAKGEKTWYFVFRVFGQELVAVLGEDKAANGFVWLTTYAPDWQTEQYRLIEPAELAAA